MLCLDARTSLARERELLEDATQSMVKIESAASTKCELDSGASRALACACRHCGAEARDPKCRRFRGLRQQMDAQDRSSGRACASEAKEWIGVGEDFREARFLYGIMMASRAGNTDVLHWCAPSTCPTTPKWSARSSTFAALKGYLHVLKWLYQEDGHVRAMPE